MVQLHLSYVKTAFLQGLPRLACSLAGSMLLCMVFVASLPNVAETGIYAFDTW